MVAQRSIARFNSVGTTRSPSSMGPSDLERGLMTGSQDTPSQDARRDELAESHTRLKEEIERAKLRKAIQKRSDTNR